MITTLPEKSCRKRGMCRAALGLVLFLASMGFAAPAGEFFFRDGDTVVMIGDSITEQHLYSNYVEMWTISRFPKWNLTFRNTGIGGDRSPGGNGRFKRDVVDLKATALTVDFGMNDGNYRTFHEDAFKGYMQGLQGMADQAKAADIRVAWLTPSPVEKSDVGPALQGYNETLEKFSAGVGEIAGKNGGWFVDQFHPCVALQDKARAENPKNRIGGTGDAVHPGPPGQAAMAWAILKGLHFPTLVSAVAIDAAAAKVLKAENCEVDNVTPKTGGIGFRRLDAALPFFPREARSILKWAPIEDELNEYTLNITGLKEGRYEIRVDGMKIGEHTAAELASGVNLAREVLAAGPIAEQVNAVWNAVVSKNRTFHEALFHDIVRSSTTPYWLEMPAAEIEAKKQAAMGKRLVKVIELEAVIRKSLEIKPHQFEVVPVKEVGR